MTRLLPLLLLASCAQHADCPANARVTLDGVAKGYTAGSVKGGRAYWHPDGPVRDEAHFHLRVGCERLRHFD